MIVIVISVVQNSQCLAVLDDVVVHLVQVLVPELEPFPNQLGRRQAHPRLLEELITGAAKCPNPELRTKPQRKHQ